MLPDFNGFFDIMLAGSQICRGFKAHDLITCQSKVQLSFPRELWSFVRPRELAIFDPWHVTRSPPIRKCIELGAMFIVYSVLHFFLTRMI